MGCHIAGFINTVIILYSPIERRARDGKRKDDRKRRRKSERKRQKTIERNWFTFSNRLVFVVCIRNKTWTQFNVADLNDKEVYYVWTNI